MPTPAPQLPRLRRCVSRSFLLLPRSISIESSGLLAVIGSFAVCDQTVLWLTITVPPDSSSAGSSGGQTVPAAAGHFSS
jgi:hypothetical protein